MIVAIADDQHAADEGIRDAALLAEERGGLGEEVQIELAQPLDEDGAEHEGEQEDGEERAQQRDDRDELLGQPTTAEVVRARRDVVGIDDLGSAHPVDILRAFWNLFTISWADTFVISEITSRIAPR